MGSGLSFCLSLCSKGEEYRDGADPISKFGGEAGLMKADVVPPSILTDASPKVPLLPAGNPTFQKVNISASSSDMDTKELDQMMKTDDEGEDDSDNVDDVIDDMEEDEEDADIE